MKKILRFLGTPFRWLASKLFAKVEDSPGGDEYVERPDLINGFHFESDLGDTLAHGYEAYQDEGRQQGYEDPTEDNYETQKKLLKERLLNYIDYEILIKKNKKVTYENAMEKSSGIVKQEISYETKMLRLDNELEFIERKRKEVEDNRSWFAILEEALHDGFQEGARKYFDEFEIKNEL